MMKKGQISLLLMAAFLLILGVLAVQCTKEQTDQQDTLIREMKVTGEIAEGYNSYIIRGKSPSTMIWTILNPEPKVLDEYIKSGKVVDIDAHIVSGDNIEIKKIDGKQYP
jgi:hypothetical protein